ncbi:MAG: hypothetical protein AVDCRST_MAG27-4536, partial [uncultured Craurococcus sp.]
AQARARHARPLPAAQALAHRMGTHGRRVEGAPSRSVL